MRNDSNLKIGDVAWLAAYPAIPPIKALLTGSHTRTGHLRIMRMCPDAPPMGFAPIRSGADIPDWRRARSIVGEDVAIAPDEDGCVALWNEACLAAAERVRETCDAEITTHLGRIIRKDGMEVEP